MYTKGNKSPRPSIDLDRQLERQLNYLDSSAKLFDGGDHEESIRLATTLRVLLHDGPSPKPGNQQQLSLLTQMGLRETLLFVDTGLYRDLYDQAMAEFVTKISPGHKLAGITPGEAGLIAIGTNPDGSPGWVAPLMLNRFRPGTPPHSAYVDPQPFSAWWERPLIEDSKLNQFSRRQLILVMANQDGGAHVDAEIDQDYAELMNDFLGVEIDINSQQSVSDVGPLGRPVSNNIAFASVRQIAFEVALTLNTHLGRSGYEPSPATFWQMPQMLMLGIADA